MSRKKGFKGKTAVVTGGSSGIGLETSGKLIEMGARVHIISRSEKRLRTASDLLPDLAGAHSADVSDIDRIEEVRRAIHEKDRNIDILVNSAGIVFPETIMDLTPERMRAVIDVDLLGTMNCCKVFLKDMKEGSHIVNISSVAGFLGLYGYTAYSAAKFGVWGFSEALRMELEPEGIEVSVIFPPDTNTPQLERENKTKPEELRTISGNIKPMEPEEVAYSIIRAISKKQFMVFPNTSTRALFSSYRLMGPAVRSWMDRKVKAARGGIENDGEE